MIEILKLPMQDKKGLVIGGQIVSKPDGYETQLKKLESLLDCCYRVQVALAIENWEFKGILLLLYKKTTKKALQ